MVAVAASVRANSRIRAAGGTVGALLEHLGPSSLCVLREGDLSRAVGRWLIFDTSEAADLRRGDVVLAVGIDPRSRGARALITLAAGADAAAIVFRSPPDQTGGIGGDGGSVTILGLEPAVVWEYMIDALPSAMREEATELRGNVPETDLHALADAVAATVGGHVTIEDLESRILAYSTSNDSLDVPRQQTILARRVPEEWRSRLQRDGIVRKLLATESAVVVDGYASHGLRTRLAIALRAGSEVLGYLWVAQSDGQAFDEHARQALREMAGVIARHIIRHRGPGDPERVKRREVLSRLLEGDTSVDADLLLGSGFRTLTTFAPTRIPDSPSTASDLSLRMDTAVELISLRFEGVDPNSVCLLRQGRIYALLAQTAPPSAKEAMDLALQIIHSCDQRLDISLVAGISPSTSTLAALPDLARQTERVVQVLARDPAAQRAATFEAVAPEAFLLELADVARNNCNLAVSGPVSRLLSHDIQHRTKYGATLRAYLDWFGDVSRTSAALSIHVNTLRYRLGKLMTLSGLNLGDPDERLVAHIQLRILDQGP